MNVCHVIGFVFLNLNNMSPPFVTLSSHQTPLCQPPMASASPMRMNDLNVLGLISISLFVE